MFAVFFPRYGLNLIFVFHFLMGPSFGFLFFNNNSDGSVIVLQAEGRVYYVRCPESAMNFEVASAAKFTSKEVLEKCQSVLGVTQSYFIPEKLFLSSLLSLLGVPTRNLGENPVAVFEKVHIENEMASRRGLPFQKYKLLEEKVFERAEDFQQQLTSHLGPDSHRKLTDSAFPQSEFAGLIISAFSPVYYDGKRAFQVWSANSLAEGSKTCPADWGWAGRTVLEETLSDLGERAHFLSFWKDKFSQSNLKPAALTTWEKRYIPRKTPQGADAFQHESLFQSLKLDTGAMESAQAQPSYFILCVRRVLPIVPLPVKKNDGILDFSELAKIYLLNPKEFFQHILLDPELALELEPVRRGLKKMDADEFAAVGKQILKWVPIGYPEYQKVLQKENESRLVLENLRKQGEIQSDQKAEQLFTEYQRSRGNGEMVLKACTRIYTHDVLVWVAVHWSGDLGLSTYGRWRIPRATQYQRESCTNVFVGNPLNPGSVYVHARTENGGTLWGEEKKLLIRTGTQRGDAFEGLVVSQSDVRSPAHKGEEYTLFDEWKIEGGKARQMNFNVTQ